MQLNTHFYLTFVSLKKKQIKEFTLILMHAWLEFKILHLFYWVIL